MTFDFHGSQRQYLEHLLPLWLELEPDERGKFCSPSNLRTYLHSHGVEARHLGLTRPAKGTGPIVVASYVDLRHIRPCRRPVVFVEHGAGQRYPGLDHPSYSGGRDRDDVVLFVCPNDDVARANAERYPEARVVVCGSPKVDRMVALARQRTSRRLETGAITAGNDGSDGASGSVAGETDGHPGSSPTVAFSFSWDWPSGPPEKRCALPYYAAEIEDLASKDLGTWKLIGHGHPKAWRQLKRFYQRAGIEPVEDFAEVCERADLYVCDNSSTIYEFAALGKPVVLLNASWYRRTIEVGLRFWEHADVGVQVDEPGDLVAGIERALTDPPTQAQRRQEVVAAVYGELDGQASARAVAAIRELGDVEAVPYVTKPDPAQHTRHPPVGRLRRLGATDTEIFAFTQEWSSLDVGERVEAQDAFAALDDDGVRDKIAEWRHG